MPHSKEWLVHVARFLCYATEPMKQLTRSLLRLIARLILMCLSSANMRAQDRSPETTLRTQHFDHDPGWEGFNNRVVPTHVPMVVQDFGYAPGESGRSKGAIGGRITRSSRPNYYADKIPAKSLNDKSSAAGSFRLSA